MKLNEFGLVGAENEKQTLIERLREFNHTKTDYPRSETTHGLFQTQAARLPRVTAAAHSGTRISYQDLDLQSNRLARLLVDRGISREDCVGVMLHRRLEVPTALLGVLKAGGAYLPIDGDCPADRAAYMLRESAASCLISERAMLDKLRGLQAKCPDLTTIYLVDGQETTADEDSNVVWRDARSLDDFDSAQLPERTDAEGLAYVIYTSGTSGQPKGVMIEHRSISRLVCNTNYVAIGEDDRLLQTGSLAFDASTFEIWGALLNGASVYLPTKDDLLGVTDFERMLKEQEITIAFLTTGLFNMYAGLGPHIFQSLRTLLTGGERVSADHVNAVRKACPAVNLLHVYGPTENTTFSSCFEVARDFTGNIPIGAPIANTTIEVLDDRLEPVPIGTQGELCTGGDGLARGYLNDRELTDEKFVPHPSEPGELLYRTGDLAKWLPDGNLEFLGRLDSQVKVRGFRIEPSEVEYHVAAQDKVREVVVAVRELGPDSRELVAYLTADEGLEVDRLREQLKNVLPEYMIPAWFVPLAALPLNANGKVDRSALPELEDFQPSKGQGRMSETETEKQLADIWQEVLGQAEIGADEDFFDLGGHSLKATKLVSLIQKRMQVSLPLTSVFKHPTIAQLADAVVQAAKFGVDVADNPLVLLKPAHDGPHVFAFPPGTGDVLSYAQLAEQLPTLNLHCFNFLEADSRIQDYADLITDTAPGPYVLAGYSGGGNIAYHVARELEARDETVSRIVMIDSSRHVRKVHFTPEYAQQLALAFLEDNAVRPFVSSVVLRDKIIRKVQAYYVYASDIVDEHQVDAEIHVIASEQGDDEYRDDDGRLVVSMKSWSEVTRGQFQIHTGAGDHNHMLYEPHVEQNARLLEQIVTSSP